MSCCRLGFKTLKICAIDVMLLHMFLHCACIAPKHHVEFAPLQKYHSMDPTAKKEIIKRYMENGPRNMQWAAGYVEKTSSSSMDESMITRAGSPRSRSWDEWGVHAGLGPENCRWHFAGAAGYILQGALHRPHRPELDSGLHV